MNKKPRLTFWQIWNMSFGFMGIQFGFGLQNANVSRIFETLGADIETIPILWLAAPVTGLLVQPIIGYMSDRTWGRFGRRKPYFMIGAILASLALFVMPNSPVLWVAAGMLWIMDASINISMEPFRALVGDMLPSSQRTQGFALQSFFIGVGAVIASGLPWILSNIFNISSTAEEGVIPRHLQYAFYIGGMVFFLTVLWTVMKTKEYSPKELRSFEPIKEPGPVAGKPVWAIETMFMDIFKMPKTMAQLALVQFFTWFALFSMWIYATPAVTKHIYNTTDTTSAIYNEGADWVGILFAVYNGVAAVVAFFIIPYLAKTYSRKTIHFISLVIGGLGLASFFVIRDPNVLLVSMVGVGIAWASILSMPYAILAGSLPGNKMGYYMGVFNFFIVIPQIIASLGWGFIIKTFFQSEAIYALLCGGGAMILAAFMVLFVHDADDPLLLRSIKTETDRKGMKV